MSKLIYFIPDIILNNFNKFIRKTAKKDGFLLGEFLLSLMIGSLLVISLATVFVLVHGRACALSKQWQLNTKYMYACTRLNSILSTISSNCTWEKWSEYELVWRKMGVRYQLLIKNNKLTYYYNNFKDPSVSMVLLELEDLAKHCSFLVLFTPEKQLKALTYSLCYPLSAHGSRYCYKGYISVITTVPINYI